jgi:hypothetical protein
MDSFFCMCLSVKSKLIVKYIYIFTGHMTILVLTKAVFPFGFLYLLSPGGERARKREREEGLLNVSQDFLLLVTFLSF